MGQLYVWTRKTVGQNTNTILTRRRRIHVCDQHHSNEEDEDTCLRPTPF